METAVNNVGIIYTTKDGIRHFYKSYLTLDVLLAAIKNDKKFIAIEKTKIDIIILS
jgi:hypothetical protein